MAEKPVPTPPTTPPAPRRGSAFRGGDAKDPMVELTERAKLISQEAGTKVSIAMRDMISAAAGIAGFAVESARDLVQFMVRRGQMTQEEADKLIREAETAHSKRPASERNRPSASKVAADKAAEAKKAALLAAANQPPRPLVPGRMVAPPLARAATPPAPAAAKKAPAKTAAKAPAAKPVAKAAAKKPAAPAKSAKPKKK